MTLPDLDNTRLEALMPHVFEDAQKNHDFLSLLFSSEVLVLGGSGDALPGTLEAGTSVTIEQWQMEDGTPFIPVFTSATELLSSVDNKESNYIAMNAGALLEMVRGTDVVINPASDHGFHIDRDSMDDLLAHFLDHDHAHGDDGVLVGQPEVDVTNLKKALADFFRGDSAVAFAALAMMARQDTSEASIVIGVSITGGTDSEKLFNAAGAAAAASVPDGYHLDMITLPEAAAPDSVEGYLAQNGDRFYTR